MTHWIGIGLVVVPILIIGATFLRRPLFLFLCLLLAAGLGYLHVTGELIEAGESVNSFVRRTFDIDPTRILP